MFNKPYDHHDYKREDVERDLSFVPITGIAVKWEDGRKCEKMDWVAIHYRTITDEGRMVEDTRAAKEHDHLFKIFQLGKYQVPKAMELNIATHLHAGERVKIKAPHAFAYGAHFEQGSF